MGQVLHSCATTTEAIRRAIQHSQASLRTLAKRYGINQKTVAKWKKRTSVADLPTGPKQAKSTVLSVEEEAVIVAFRRYTLLPLDDCLYALQPTIPAAAAARYRKGSRSAGFSWISVRSNRRRGNSFENRPSAWLCAASDLGRLRASPPVAIQCGSRNHPARSNGTGSIE